MIFVKKFFIKISRNWEKSSGTILLISLIICLLQIVWFWKFCSRNINIDAISYIGIARHIRDGNFKASINGYWSPLFSWLISLGSLINNDFTLIARVLTIVSLFACLALIYLMTKKLWDSTLLASFAVLWFVCARGIVAFSVDFIGADLLLTAFVLFYFVIMINCIKNNSYWSWFTLGVAHSLAFLAKSFALPWLSLTTVLAAIIINKKNLKKCLFTTSVAFMIPIIIWMAWGKVLQSKYGVFMSGSQFRRNSLRFIYNVNAAKYGLLIQDTRKGCDKYLVADPVPPGSEQWRESLINRNNILKKILSNEIKNIPTALKELIILITPGGILAFLFGLFVLIHRRVTNTVQARLMLIVLFSSVSLVLAYSLLVLDGRYVIPLVPLIMAVSVRFILPKRTTTDELSIKHLIQYGFLAVITVSIIFFTFYWASPFRRLTKDFQQCCYDGAQKLLKEPSINNGVVSIGAGPYPDQGVGPEAGIYTAYFANVKFIGRLSINDKKDISFEKIIYDLHKLKPSAVLLWGNQKEIIYRNLVTKFKKADICKSFKSIMDPSIGEVGMIFYMS